MVLQHNNQPVNPYRIRIQVYMRDLGLKPSKEYPRIPYYLSGPLVTLLIGISAILGSIMLGVIMYLIIDAKFCGTNANIHSVSLSSTATLGTNGLTSLLHQTEIPTYDGGYDIIVRSTPEVDTFNPNGNFSFAMLLNYTAYPNANRRSSLVALNITGNRAESPSSMAGSTVSLHVSNPNRKRIYITEPWFDYGYWTSMAQDHPTTKSDIPLWLVDMKEAGRGRQGRRICAADYGAEIVISSELFQIDPLVVREFAGEDVTFSNIVVRGESILDLTPRPQDGHVNVQLLEADVAKLYMNKPPETIRIVMHDKTSFLLLAIPFVEAPSLSLYRTIYRSFETVAYMRPSIQLVAQPIVEIDVVADRSFADQVSCHEELDRSLTFIAAEPTLSKIILIVAPVGLGTCSCEESSSGRCVVSRSVESSYIIKQQC